MMRSHRPNQVAEFLKTHSEHFDSVIAHHLQISVPGRLLNDLPIPYNDATLYVSDDVLDNFFKIASGFLLTKHVHVEDPESIDEALIKEFVKEPAVIAFKNFCLFVAMNELLVKNEKGDYIIDDEVIAYFDRIASQLSPEDQNKYASYKENPLLLATYFLQDYICNLIGSGSSALQTTWGKDDTTRAAYRLAGKAQTTFTLASESDQHFHTDEGNKKFIYVDQDFYNALYDNLLGVANAPHFAAPHLQKAIRRFIRLGPFATYYQDNNPRFDVLAKVMQSDQQCKRVDYKIWFENVFACALDDLFERDGTIRRALLSQKKSAEELISQYLLSFYTYLDKHALFDKEIIDSIKKPFENYLIYEKNQSTLSNENISVKLAQYNDIIVFYRVRSILEENVRQLEDNLDSDNAANNIFPLSRLLVQIDVLKNSVVKFPVKELTRTMLLLDAVIKEPNDNNKKAFYDQADLLVKQCDGGLDLYCAMMAFPESNQEIYKRPSPSFAAFLRRPDVYEPFKDYIKKEISDLKKYGDNQAIAGCIPAFVDRYFNAVQKNYVGNQSLVESIQDAYQHNNIEAWCDFAILKVKNELFDRNGNTRLDVYAALNVPLDEPNQGALDWLIEKYKTAPDSDQKIKSFILHSYLVNIVKPKAVEALYALEKFTAEAEATFNQAIETSFKERDNISTGYFGRDLQSRILSRALRKAIYYSLQN